MSGRRPRSLRPASRPPAHTGFRSPFVPARVGEGAAVRVQPRPRSLCGQRTGLGHSVPGAREALILRRKGAAAQPVFKDG